MPTDMRALQDFEEEDKLQIKMNDVITIIEGRSVGDAKRFRSVFVAGERLHHSWVTSTYPQMQLSLTWIL